MDNYKNYLPSLAQKYFDERQPIDEHSLFPMEATQEKVYLGLKSRGADYKRIGDIKAKLVMDASIDVARIERALRETVDAHVAFSLDIVEKDGVPMLTKKRFPFALDIKEIKDEEYNACATAFFETPRAEGAALYSFMLVKTPSHTYLLFRFCHALLDGMSSVSFTTELCTRYNGIDVMPEQYNFLDYADYKQKVIDSDEGKTLLAEFGKLIEGYPKVVHTKPTADVAEYNGTLFNKSELNSLRPFTKKMKISAATLLLASYSLALMRMCGTDRIAYAMAFHGRTAPQFAKTFGCLSHKIPILARIPESGSVEEYLRDFNETQQLMQERYSIIDKAIMKEYSQHINFMMSVNILLTMRNLLFDGKEVKAAKTPMHKMAVPLMAMVDVRNTGWDIKTFSSRWNDEELQSLHDSVRSIMLGMAQKGNLSEI